MTWAKQDQAISEGRGQFKKGRNFPGDVKEKREENEGGE